MSDDDVVARILEAPRADAVSVLVDAVLAGELPTEGLREVLPVVWSSAKFPSLRQKWFWVDLWRRIGFVTDDGLPPPTEPMTIFRGATWGRRRGMSWTSDRDQARWFAERFGRFAGSHHFVEACVFTATIDPGGVLARLNYESEVVVDPAFLPPIRKRDAEVVPRQERTPA